MAFDSVIGQHNYIGVHVDGAAATTWVQANNLDTLHNGTGTPIDGMMFYSSTTNQLYFWDTSNWVNYSGEIEGGIHVSETYGSDASGDGTMGNPYKTLAHACSVQPVPDLLNFWQPMNFYLSPGSYLGDVTIPQRLSVAIRGHNCYIEGNIQWPIDPELWFTFGLDPNSNFPCLSIAVDSAEGTMDRRLAESGVSNYPARAIILSSGDLSVTNANPGTANPMPSHVLTLDGVLREDFRILNMAAGTADQNDATKTLFLNLINSYTSGTCIIAGDPDYDVGGGWIEPNEVVVFARNAALLLYGCCQIVRIEDCSYEADYTLNYKGNPFDYGRIHGGARTTNIIRSTQEKKFGSLFGINAAAAVPHTYAYAIKFDRESLMQMASTTRTFTDSFHDFDTADPSAGYGRGWFFDECNLGTACGVMTIPHDSYGYGPFRLFVHAYLYAQYQQPYGKAVSSDNRYLIYLEPGRYIFVDNFAFQHNYVDVLGLGSETVGVEFYLDQYALTWEPTDAAFHHAKITNTSDGLTEAFCLRMDSAATNCSFKGLSFFDDSGIGGAPMRAVMIDPALAPTQVRGTWTECYTPLDGFLYGGNISPTLAVRCRAGDHSFGAWDGGAPLDLTVSGVFEDCVAGNYSFASTRVGGNVSLAGTLSRCTTSGYGFAHTSGGVIQYTATCSATMTDCDNKLVGGGKSFGYAQRGQATSSGVFIRCNSSDHSFGSSESGTVGDYGIFSGQAYDCQSGHLSFGANASILTQSRFSGLAERCVATHQSFGARGEFTGKAKWCRATYGSFGDQTSFSKSELLECTAYGIMAAANQGPPGIFGALVRRCYFIARTGEDVVPLMINGGTAGAGTESRVFDCDLFSDTHASCIDALGGGPFEVQMAHCRSRTDLGAGVSNVLVIGLTCNLVDPAYNPD